MQQERQLAHAIVIDAAVDILVVVVNAELHTTIVFAFERHRLIVVERHHQERHPRDVVIAEHAEVVRSAAGSMAVAMRQANHRDRWSPERRIRVTLSSSCGW
jgi:hypothetical protein